MSFSKQNIVVTHDFSSTPSSLCRILHQSVYFIFVYWILVLPLYTFDTTPHKIWKHVRLSWELKWLSNPMNFYILILILWLLSLQIDILNAMAKGVRLSPRLPKHMHTNTQAMCAWLIFSTLDTLCNQANNKPDLETSEAKPASSAAASSSKFDSAKSSSG